MWVRHWSIGLLFVVGGLLSPVVAEETLHWQWSLESARQIAGQSNRLVLVHFWAEWCGPCKRMEADVFSRSDVAAAIEANYVPVKVNRDHLPATAQQFGVTGIPADVILTPQGAVLERFQGYTEAGQYVGRLNRVAAVYHTQKDRIYAQIPASQLASAQPTSPAPTNGPVPTNGPAPMNGSGVAMPGARAPGYGPSPALQGYADNRPLDAMNRAPQAGAAMPANPPYGGPIPAQDPLAPQQTPPMGPQGYAGAAPSSNYPGGGPSPAMGQPYPEMAPPNRQANLPPQGMTPQDPQMAGSPGSGSAASRAIEIPPGNPPLGLDGYCPVQLMERERWVRGNPKWGVRHEGRTYLFAGPEEQSRFYADPDRYAPVLCGDDVVIMIEQGQRIPGRREYGGWFQNRVYLFSSEATFQKFFSDPHRYADAVAQARTNIAARPGNNMPVNRAPAGAWNAPNPSAPGQQYR